jgi:hypothetical protein
MSEFLSRKHGSVAVLLEVTIKGLSLLNPLHKQSICASDVKANIFVGAKHFGSKSLVLINKLPAEMLRPSTH